MIDITKKRAIDIDHLHEMFANLASFLLIYLKGVEDEA